MPLTLTDMLLPLVCLTLLVGLAAGELATLIRVGAKSWPALARVWTWSKKGAPLLCPTCLGAHCTLLVLAGAALVALACGYGEPSMLFGGVFAATPRFFLGVACAVYLPAAAIAAIVQRQVIVEEFVLPELPVEPALKPDEFRVPQALLDDAALRAEGKKPEFRRDCDCKTCREYLAERAAAYAKLAKKE